MAGTSPAMTEFAPLPPLVNDAQGRRSICCSTYLAETIRAQATEALIQRCNSLFGPAPVFMATCLPFLNTISVGIERMPNCADTFGFSSTLSLATLTLPFI